MALLMQQQLLDGGADESGSWVQHREGTDKDWAGTGRYLNVVRIDEFDNGPSGNATDFPIFSKLSDEQILIAFVSSVCAITGTALGLLYKWLLSQCRFGSISLF